MAIVQNLILEREKLYRHYTKNKNQTMM